MCKMYILSLFYPENKISVQIIHRVQTMKHLFMEHTAVTGRVFYLQCPSRKVTGQYPSSSISWEAFTSFGSWRLGRSSGVGSLLGARGGTYFSGSAKNLSKAF